MKIIVCQLLYIWSMFIYKSVLTKFEKDYLVKINIFEVKLDMI